MRTFVEECRREWKRLDVPDAVADEMAADLEADLAEAEADGVPADELLGSGASAPRAFAAEWAAARGVVRTSGVRRGSTLRAVTAAFVVVAIVGAVLAILGAPSERTASIGVAPPRALDATGLWVASPNRREVVRVWVPEPRLLAGAAGDDLREAGLLVLVAGIGGVVLSTLLWSGAARRPA
jgi:hypothetical protein